MSVRTDISAAASSAFLAIAKCLGVQVTYTARGTAITGLYCVPKSGTNASMRETVGTRSIEQERQFDIPTQTGFPPTGGLTVDDEITDENGNVYRVQTWNNNDDIGAVYTFDGVYEITKQIGAVGQ
jgi:hypothetical protein